MSTVRLACVIGWVLASVQLHALPLKVACIGDSITEGTGLSNPASESYPAKLQRLMGTNEWTVRNFGVSGRTLLKQGDYPYWKESYFKTSHDWLPDVVIIQLGTNDAKPYNWRYGTNFVSDYEEMIASYAALTNSPRIILCTPCPVYGTGAYDIVPSTVATNIAPAVRDISNRLGLELTELNTRLAGHRELFRDNVHPNSKGMTVMAAVLYDTLVESSPADFTPAVGISIPGASRIALSWPEDCRGWVPQTATAVGGTNTAWSVVEQLIYLDGSVVRQTNTASGTLRVYRLWQP